MKKLTALFITAIMVLALGCGLAFIGCGNCGGDNEIDKDAIQNMEGGIVLANHDCTVTLTSIDPFMEGTAAIFKSDIKASDITLAEGLKGKTVSSVTFIDSETIEVSLTGKVNSFNADDPYGKIIVSKRALENDQAGFANLLIKKAEMRVASLQNANGNYTVKLQLNVGEFKSSITKQDVTLASGSDGAISRVAVENGLLVIEILGASQTPSVVIAASATNFNRQVTITLRIGTSVVLE